MIPGQHVAVVGSESAALRARRSGLHLRDCLSVLMWDTSLFVWLFRVPLTEPTVTQQVAATGTGGLHLSACELDGGRWPTNLLLVHHPDCGQSCHAHCPVVVLDEQSGQLQSGAVSAHHMRNNSQHLSDGGYHGKMGDMPLQGYGDSGGASRFFPQFASLQECLAWVELLLGGGGGQRRSLLADPIQ